MILPGHVAAAYLAACVLHVDMRSTLCACMYPDLIDKPLRWLFGLTPNDRIPAHSLPWAAMTTCLVVRLGGKSYVRGWMVGYAAHLLCDEVNAQFNPGRIYPWWPFKRYTYHRGPTGLHSSLRDFGGVSLILEVIVALCGLAVWRRRHPIMPTAISRRGAHASR